MMGYDLVGKTSLKDYKEKGYDGSVVAHVQCPYAWQTKFVKAIGCQITEFNGRLTNKNYKQFIEALNKIIKMLQSGEAVTQYKGNLANCSTEKLLEDFIALKNGVDQRKIKYVDIS